MKPRVRFCWDCGKKLFGNSHKILVFEADGHERILHKFCADTYRDFPGVKIIGEGDHRDKHTASDMDPLRR